MAELGGDVYREGMARGFYWEKKSSHIPGGGVGLDAPLRWRSGLLFTDVGWLGWTWDGMCVVHPWAAGIRVRAGRVSLAVTSIHILTSHQCLIQTNKLHTSRSILVHALSLLPPHNSSIRPRLRRFGTSLICGTRYLRTRPQGGRED